MDSLERFIDYFRVEHSSIVRYTERKNYRRWSGRGIFLGMVLLFGVGWLAGNYPVVENAWWGDALALAVLLTIISSAIAYFVAEHHLNQSKLDEEKVAMHELATAIAEYEAENYQNVVEHLSEANYWISRADLSLLSKERKEQVHRFIDRIENAKDDEEAVKEAFEEFAKSLTEEIIAVRDEPLDSKTDQIEQSPYKNRSSIGRFRKDFGQFLVSGLMSFWGLLLGSLAVGATVAFFYEKPTFGAAIPTIFLTAYQVYKNRK